MEKQFLEKPLITNSSSHETQPSNPVRKCSDTIIPIDLLIDIFSRVPAKSVARLRCVSKLWAYVLARPDFTELFLTKSSNRPRLLFTLKANGKLFFYSSPQPHNHDQDDDSYLVATRYRPSNIEFFSLERCNPVCGSFLLKERKERLICNPATGEFLTFPKVEANSHTNKFEVFYLGYDPISKQYKVLCMNVNFWSDEITESSPDTHLVLTIKTGKPLWRKIDHKFHLNRELWGGEICINGVLYFGADFDRSSVIVSFDVRSEKFGFINTDKEEMLPMGGYFSGSLTLFNYKGKLGIHRNKDIYWFSPELVFWVLEDAGNHKWSRHVYVLSRSEKDIARMKRFCGMTSTGEFVWSPYPGCVSDPFDLFFHNLESKTFTRVNIQGFNKEHTILSTFLGYEENIMKKNTWSQLNHTPN